MVALDFSKSMLARDVYPSRLERAKRELERLKEAVPGLTRVAVLWNGANPVKVRDFDEVRGGAKALGMRVDSIEIRVASDLDTAQIVLKLIKAKYLKAE